MTQKNEDQAAPKSQETQLAELPAINPAILPIIPKSLQMMTEPRVWQAMKMGVQLYAAQNGLPKGVTQSSAVMLMLTGVEYGMDPFMAISKLFMVGGRITPSANTMMELATANGLRIKPLQETDEVWEAEFTRPDGHSITMKYTLAEARKAQLLGSDTWQKHPRWMLRARCVSAAIRLIAGDLVKGMEYNAEEVTNGSGYFDASGNFTPDESVMGPKPEDQTFRAFEGVKEPRQAAPKTKTSTVATEDHVVTPDPASEPESPEHPLEEAQAMPQQVGMLPQGKVIALAHDAAGTLDFDGSVKNIAAALAETEGSVKAGNAKAKALMAEIGVAKALEMKGKATFIQFYLKADEYCAEQNMQAAAEEEPAAEIPAFDPHRGARTQSASGEVADANPDETVDYDAQIIAIFTAAAERQLDAEYTQITEATGYLDDAEDAPVAVKMETLEKLQAFVAEHNLQVA